MSMRDLNSGIGALKLLGYRFQYEDNPTLGETVLLGSFAWPQHYDRVMISTAAAAAAVRISSSGAGAGSVTWSCQGDAAAVVWALVNLAPPTCLHDQKRP